MKRILTKLVAVVVIMGASTLSAQAQVKDNVIKINPLGLLFGNMNLGYEKVFNEKTSLNTNVNYLFRSLDVGIAEWKYTGFGLSPQFRYYVTNASKEAPTGFYVGPYLTFNSLSMKYSESSSDLFGGANSNPGEGKLSVITFGGGAILGYQWLFNDVIALDLFFGAGYVAGSAGDFKIKYKDGTESVSPIAINYEGFWPTGGAAIGFGF